MNKAEPALLMILLALLLAALAVRVTFGKYLSASQERLDCRLGYYGLLSLASHYPRAAVTDFGEWTQVTFKDGHFLFSKPGAPAHQMVVLRKTEDAGGRPNVTSQGCAFGSEKAYKEAMTKLPPAMSVSPANAVSPGAARGQ